MGLENRKVILWLEGCDERDEVYDEVNKYAEIRKFNFESLVSGTPFVDVEWNLSTQGKRGKFTEDSNLIRLLLLYKYGGVWFDLDVLFLKNFDPIFVEYGNEICLYAWQRLSLPNNAIVISLSPRSGRLESAIFYINDRAEGFSFRRARITYNLPLEFLILPCSWFDPGWISADFKREFGRKPFPALFVSTSSMYSFDNFFKHAFCFHWHNGWDRKIQTNSALGQLSDELDQLIGSKLLPLK
jgi:hypothetical protein